MAISIGGTVVIDDDRNIVNAGDIRVGLVTITGSTGNIQTPGTITSAGYITIGAGVSFSPASGSTVDPVTTGSITISFPTNVSRGIGTITLRTGIGSTGPIVKSYDAATAPEIKVLDNAWTLYTVPADYQLSPKQPILPFGATLSLVIPASAINGFAGANVGGASTTYNFNTSGLALGGATDGGYLICKQGGTIRWIVSERAAEVSRTWYLRNDSNTLAQKVSGCSGWFVPTCAQQKNPGYLCRAFWGPSPCYSTTPVCFYWSSTIEDAGHAYAQNMSDGVVSRNNMAPTFCVRSFRCVTY